MDSTDNGGDDGGALEKRKKEEKEREEIGNRSEHCSNRRARFDMTN